MTASPTLIYSATCPRCGSGVVDTLWSDPRVPIYDCGSLPYQVICPIVDAPAVHDDLTVNVTIPTGEDLADYATIVGLASIAWAQDPPTLGGRIGLCEVMHCESTAVDGRCMEHSA
jgi:hypothetical protein